MGIWMVFIVISMIAIVIEMVAPSMFCINFAIAGIISAIVSIFWGGFLYNLIIFVVLSLLSIIFLKPILVKTLKKGSDVDFDSQYIGKIVKVIEPISKSKGAITVYEERWEARLSQDGDEIPVNSEVKIVSNDSTILFVERI